jgi:ATP-dependent DNA helicase PIF1
MGDKKDVLKASKRIKLQTSMTASSSTIRLDPKQQQILELCLSGHNIFFSGIGGTGKTFLLQQISEGMRSKLGSSKVAVAASTGVAAVICHGQTLHSLAGCGVPSVVSDFDKCLKQKRMWLELAVLIIDEVSMIEPPFLDWLDATVRSIRKKPDNAFGGIQLIFCGDFGQLSGICKGVSLTSECPVKSDFSARQIPVHVDQFQSYVFQTMCWRDAAFIYRELTTVFRQSEVAMVSALTKIRRCQLDDEVLGFIASCDRELPSDDEIKGTVLYTRNKDVDKENVTNLYALPGPLVSFAAVDSVYPERGAPVWAREKLLRDPFFKSAVVPDCVVLKVGAQVMLTKNLPEEGLVNGSRGVVKHFASKEETIKTLTARNSKLGTVDHCIGGITNQNRDTVMAMRQIIDAQLETVGKAPATAAYPVVLFCNGKEFICCPMQFNHSIYMTGECRRMQVPLKLAWALTVHKSQGATLDKVKVDLNGCFSPGQCYVALSRAKSSAGLQIIGFTKETVKTHPIAIAFHDALTAGTLDVFLQTVPRWFEPVLHGGTIDPNWRALFESSVIFQKWAMSVLRAAAADV